MANPAAQQAQQHQTQQSPSQQQANQRSNQSPTGTYGDRRVGVPFEQALIKKLHEANQAEIEQAMLAQKKTDNPELQQLTRTIIEDHKACNQKLQQLDTMQAVISGECCCGTQ